MNPIQIKYFLMFILLLLTASGFSQEKFEQEKRIKPADVPQKSRQQVESIDADTKIKWYLETGLTSRSYEAKTKLNGKRLSIEFSSEGDFEDIEVLVEPGKLPEKVNATISKYFSGKYGKYKYRRTQIQYAGEFNSIVAFLNDSKDEMDVLTRYEIIISTKLEGSYVLFEYLFDEEGSFVKRSRIIPGMTDNIEY